jgi:hypothetical protein
MINKFKERRVEQKTWDWRVVNVIDTAEKRATVHDYSTPPKLYEVWIEVDPQPIKERYKSLDFIKRFLMDHCPLKPGDVIKEEWVDPEGDGDGILLADMAFLLSHPTEQQRQDHIRMFNMVEPASTMPESLNHLCHKVLAVLGVEEVEVSTGYYCIGCESDTEKDENCCPERFARETFGDSWHFKYLTTERFKSIVSIGH